MKTENKKADSYFDNNEFSRAIPLYKKDADNNDAALRRLGDCYRILKNYPEAELAYEKLASKNPSDPMVYYYYGEALLNNNKYEAAKKQFVRYSELNPADKKGELYAKACDQMKDIIVKPALYKAYNLGDVNSQLSDFCPVFYKSGLVFASERVRDLVNYSENNFTGNPDLSLVYAKATKKSITVPTDSAKATEAKEKDTLIYSKASLLSDKFSGDGHYGPASFNADFSEIYFTKVDNSTSRKRPVNLPKLYYSKHQSGWSSPKEMPFATGEFITGHPSLSKDGTLLYFTSNMPGGQGGTDIWVSKREGENWAAPLNLGTEVNTAGDESFPYISPENILYFASNGQAGFGGLDLFASVNTEGKWSKVNNMMPPINSSSDDFGIIFKDDNSGYFSSNRTGGNGSDDLYGFALSGMITSISGKILLSQKTDDGAQNVKVFLITDKGTILQTTSTDGSGFFQFQNLLSDQNYTVRIDESDPSLINQKKFYLTDAKNKIVRTIVKGKEGIFVFENLPPDLSRLTALNEEDVTKNYSIAGNLYAGDQRKALENAKVNLLNEKGEIIQSTTTNAFGSFVFTNISPDDNLTVTLDDADPKLASKKIYFTNKSGKEIAMSKDGKFKFEILASDTNTLSLLAVEDNQLLVDMKGILYSDKAGKNKLANSSISLVDENGKVVETSKTDASGNFKFTNLASDKNYLVRLNEDDPTLTSKDVFLANAEGKVVATLKSSNGKFFRYSFLPTEDQSLVNIYFDDPWLQVAKAQYEAKKTDMSIAGNIKVGDARAPVKNAKVNLRNSKGEIVQTVTTDASGSFAFTNLPTDENFTITLDEMDPKLASQKIFLTNKNGKEVATKEGRTFKFETLSSDKNTLSALEVEDEQLLISMKGTLYSDKDGKNRLRNTTVNLVDENGKVVGTAQTDADGNFKFVNLPSDKNYTIRLNEEDPSIASKDIFLGNAKGKVMATLKSSDGKFFKYEVLPMDAQSLASIHFDDASLQGVKSQYQTKKTDISIAGNIKAGDSRSPVKNARVNLRNSKGEIVQTVTTDASGSFAFTNLPTDENFTITLDEMDPKLASQKIFLSNKNGKEVATKEGRTFRFETLSSDKNTLSALEVEDEQLLVSMNGILYSDKDGKNRLSNATVNLVDENGKVIGTVQTDADGNFKFINLPSDKNYTIRLNEEDPAIASKDIFLADSKGKVVAPLKSAEGKFFKYEVLPMDAQSLASIYFDDASLSVSKTKTAGQSGMTIIENVYYDYQKWNLLPQAIITLDKVVKAMKTNKNMKLEIISNTDARGAEDYNLKLSQKRAQAAVNYLILKGINKTRLTAVGKGESQPVNRCTEGVVCTEEEYAENRRTEFVIKGK